jgi:maltodextrin utilization protein YvdJ
MILATSALPIFVALVLAMIIFAAFTVLMVRGPH